MPQLEVSTFFSQVFWFLVFFFLLFFIVNFLFIPKLNRIIKIRNERILDYFRISIQILRLIEKVDCLYYEKLNKTKIQAKNIINNALLKRDEMKISMENTLEEKNKRIHKIVEKKVKKFRNKYDNELKYIATDIAMIYYTKLVNNSNEIDKKIIYELISKEF